MQVGGDQPGRLDRAVRLEVGVVGDPVRVVAAGPAPQEVRLGALRAEPFSLATALYALVEGLDDPDFRVVLDLDGPDVPGRAGPEALYRVAQEALTNARRHADAGLVRVAVRSTGDDAVLSVEDDGRGFEPEATAGGGLTGMRERLAVLGGTVCVESSPGRGTRITASVPVAAR